MSNPFLGEIKMVAFTFAAKGWATCDGQILPISQNTALFSLFGTQFGGNGTSNFGLPNMQGNVPIHQGHGQGLSPYIVGETGGTPSVVLTLNELGPHNHAMIADTNTGTSPNPTDNIASAPDVNPRFPNNKMYTSAAVPRTPMLAGTLLPAGNVGPHNNVMPYQVQLFIVALQGIYPQRG